VIFDQPSVTRRNDFMLAAFNKILRGMFASFKSVLHMGKRGAA